MSKTYDEWLKYYEGCNKAQVIFDIMLDEQEIERLNNIINEFDKFLFGELQTYGGGGTAQEYYDKLQELKGSEN